MTNVDGPRVGYIISDNAALYNNPFYLFESDRLLRNLSAEDVSKTFEKHIDPENSLVFITLPETQ
jgi:hypothetical protein